LEKKIESLKTLGERVGQSIDRQSDAGGAGRGKRRKESANEFGGRDNRWAGGVQSVVNKNWGERVPKSEGNQVRRSGVDRGRMWGELRSRNCVDRRDLQDTNSRGCKREKRWTGRKEWGKRQKNKAGFGGTKCGVANFFRGIILKKSGRS